MYNLVVICSAIHTNSKPLNYHPIRSKFTHEERFQQTLQTIKSIREKIPHSYIVLVEVTELNPNYYLQLKEMVDYVFLTYTIPEVYKITEGIYKGLGEITSLYYYLLSDHFTENRNQFISLSKISGRYKLLPLFNFEVNPSKMITSIHPYHHSHGNLNMSTMFYTVPNSLFDIFIKSAYRCIRHPGLVEGCSLESIFPVCLEAEQMPFQRKFPLRVGGEVGPWGGFVEH